MTKLPAQLDRRISCCQADCARAPVSTTSRASQTNQTFNTNIYDASRQPAHTSAATSSAPGGPYSLNGDVRSQRILLQSDQLRGHGKLAARSAIARNERPVPGTPLYVSARRRVRAPSQRPAATGETEVDRGLTRLDFSPQVAFPVQEVAVVHRQLDGDAGATRTTRAATI